MGNEVKCVIYDEKKIINQKKIKNDIILIVGILAAISVAALVFFLSREPGDTVIITVDGMIFGEYRLDEDRTVEIRSKDGINVLVIEDGRAFVSDASCPDGICAKHRPIMHDGDSIICLPNKVVITVTSRRSDAPDIVA